MFRERDFINSPEKNVNAYGVTMDQRDYCKIKSKLNLLKDRAPAQCSFDLLFENSKSSIVGTISIRSISENFYSTKVGHSPFQVYELLEKEIDQQLLEWKKRRFRQNLNIETSYTNSNSQTA